MTVLVAAFIIMIAVGVGCNQQRKRAENYQKTIDELNTEIKDLKDTNEALESEKNNLDTDEFKEKMARERLGMIGKDEYSLEESDQEVPETAPEESEKNENND